MILYHGSYLAIEVPDIIHSRNNVDFGKGFYTTPIYDQAKSWCGKFLRRNRDGIISRYRFDESGCGSLKILRFDTYSEEWLDFIVACRSGQPHDYDIVIGAMADDQIYSNISDYMDGTITREQFWVLAKFKYPTHQIAFCTEEALKCLNYRGAEEVQ